MTSSGFVAFIFLFLIAYFLILAGYYLFCGIIALFEVHTRARQHELEDYTLLSNSIFTLPVSILIPAHNEEEWVLDSVKSALNQEYPEFEVIIINDGSTDATLKILHNEFDLESIPGSSDPEFRFGAILDVLVSKNDPRIKVISKKTGFKKAGASNAGLALATYPYVCVVDADTILEPDALPKVMAHIVKDPENILGAGSYFGLINGCPIKNGRITERRFSFNPILAYQNLEYLRSFISMRTAWSRFNAAPIIAGGFGIWRKDILLELGGYSPEYSSEDLEMTFRVRDYVVKNRKTSRIIALPYFVGWTEGPDTLPTLIQQRNRWQRVLLETVWHYRHMICNVRYGSLAFFTLPYLLVYEALGTVIETASIAVTVWGWTAGFLNPGMLFAIFILMALSQAMISLISIYVFTRDQNAFRPRMIAHFVLLSFLELLWYRWILSVAKIAGTVDFLRGKKQYDQYTRRKRGNS